MDVESPRASRLLDAIIASNTGQVLGFWIGTEEKGGDCKLSVNVVVSRNASQSNEVPIVPILRSVTGTLRIAAGLLTPGIRRVLASRRP